VSAPLPEGNVTILFAGIEDASRILQQPGIGEARYREEMLQPYFTRLRQCLADTNGHELTTLESDHNIAVFQSPDDALACARALQVDLAAEPIACRDAEGLSIAIPDGTPWRIRVRIGIHRAGAPLPAGCYEGADVAYAAYIMRLGLGGQILVSAGMRAATSSWESYRWQGWDSRILPQSDAEPEIVYEMLWKPGSPSEVLDLRDLPGTFRVERDRSLSHEKLEESVKLNNRGVDHVRQRRWEEAITCFQQSVDIKREYRDRPGEADTLQYLGKAYRDQGSWEDASACYLQMLAIRRTLPDRVAEGKALRTLMALKVAQRDYAAALDYARQALLAFEPTQEEAQKQFLREWIAKQEARLPEPRRRQGWWHTLRGWMGGKRK